MASDSAAAAADIDALLRGQRQKTLLRFITCGSVDDGKSTLIGRLLYESKVLHEDQMAILERDSRKAGDSSGELDGIKFADAAGLAKAVHDDSAAPACVVSRAYSYGVGRLPAKSEGDFVKALQQDFQGSGYRFPQLLKKIATSDEFYRVAPPQTGALDTPASKLAQVNSTAGSNQENQK